MARRRLLVSVACGLLFAGIPALAAATPTTATGPTESSNVAWLRHVDTPSAVTGMAFIRYSPAPAGDVLFANGPFGLRAWSLADPTRPVLIGELPASALVLPGDDVSKGFWEGEHLQADPARHLVFLSRDPRAFGGNEQTGISGLYVIDARNPHRLRLITFHPVPAGHTTDCIDGCRYLWTGGPVHSGTGHQPPDWAGQPAWVTDMTHPRRPSTFPTPVDLNRNDGVTDYVHDTDVDAMGVAWTSGAGGVRGYFTSGAHRDPVSGQWRIATPADPVPYAGGKIISPNDPTYTFDHNSWHPLRGIGGFAPGDLLFVTDEDFGETCTDSGDLLVVSLAGSYGGEGWRSTPAHPFRLRVVGSFSPAGQPGEQAGAENDCSAHWFQPLTGVGDGDILVQAFYGQGTRFIDISDPRHPVQVGYFVPPGSEAATPAFHDGLVYAAQYSGGIDVLHFTPPTGAHP